MARILLLIILIGLLPGCATSGINIAGDRCYNKSLPALLDATDLKSLFRDIGRELCADGCAESALDCSGDKIRFKTCDNDSGARRATVLVTDFADIQTFVPNQSGLLMGELMRASLNEVCCYKIVQAEFAKYFKLSENGLVALTRKVKEIKNDEYSQPEMIVGTYSYANNNKVVIFVRRIDTETGKISKMVMRELNYSCADRTIIGYSFR